MANFVPSSRIRKRYVAVLAFAVIAALAKFGIQTTSFIAVLGAAGLAVGLVLQGSLSHFAAGVMILIFRPIRIDDLVEAGGYLGRIWRALEFGQRPPLTG